MESIKIYSRLEYESPRADAVTIALENVICGSSVSAETGASWTDETDASLNW